MDMELLEELLQQYFVGHYGHGMLEELLQQYFVGHHGHVNEIKYRHSNNT